MIWCLMLLLQVRSYLRHSELLIWREWGSHVIQYCISVLSVEQPGENGNLVFIHGDAYFYILFLPPRALPTPISVVDVNIFGLNLQTVSAFSFYIATVAFENSVQTVIGRKTSSVSSCLVFKISLTS